MEQNILSMFEIIIEKITKTFEFSTDVMSHIHLGV